MSTFNFRVKVSPFIIFSLLCLTSYLSFGQQIESYDSPGTGVFTVPENVVEITVEVWGAGGGGLTQNNASGGGGGGGYARSILTVNSGDTFNFTVGKGGTPGVDGENSLFDTTVIGGGGTSGIGVAGGNGGVGSGGNAANFNGGNGGDGQTNGNVNNRRGGGGGGSAFSNANGNDAGNGNSGAGGTGEGNGGQGARGSVDGGDGLNPGGGGGGKGKDGDPGEGADGLIRITYTIINPCDAEASGNTDTDGDGVSDICDLDSDNDGILDEDESVNEQLAFEFYDSTPSGNSVDNIPKTTPDYRGYVSDFDVIALSTDLTGNTDRFSIRYKGSIEITASDTYTFYTSSDDGSKLFINGTEVVDNDGLHANRERSGSIVLESGVYDIELLFFENTGQQNLSVSYESSSISKTALPFSILAVIDDDGDGIPNHFDLDSDNDGIYDALEANPVLNPSDIGADGRLTGGVDDEGVPLVANGGFEPIDSDSDDVPNFKDLDSDGDGCSDANEYYNNPSADGGDDRVFGIGAPTVNADGLIVGAGYDGVDYANVIDNSINSGCDPYIFETTGTWETSSNWNFNRLPTAIDTAVVRANASVTITQEVGTLTIDPAFIVSIDTLQRLNIKENLTNNGNFEGEGYVVFDGTSAQQIISGDGTDAGSFTNMRVNNPAGLSITDNADLLNVLDLQNGVFAIAPDKILTFKSTATQTAVLSEVGSSADITGCVVVERYIPPSNRAFRYIASSVNTFALCDKESIKANLQEGNQVTDFTNYQGVSESPGYGTHITGSTTGDFGFDATQTGNPSMFSWNQNTQAWNAIPNTLDTGANTLDIGNSYSLMIRGGRELNLNISNSVTGQDPTTLRFTGELTTGDVVVNNLATGVGEFSLIANPYQAQVNIKELMNSASATNIKKNIIYIYDPTINRRGGYVTVDLASENSTPSRSTANKFLQPNQSMFIENAGPSPSLTFKETYKKDLNPEFTNRTFSVDNAASLDITLKRKDNSNLIVADGVRLYFEDSYDNAIQNNDALKFWNSDESLAINQADKYLSIERRKYPASEESVQLSLFNSKSADYQFEFDAQDFDKTAYLKDHYTGSLQEIENNTVSVYAFTADTQIPESVATTRFELVFEETTLGVEDINIKDIRVYPNPASEIVHIQIPNATGENYRLQVTDMAGRLIFTESVKAVNGRISTRKIESLDNGVYLINIEIDGQDYTKKLIIN